MTTINITEFIERYNDFSQAGDAVFCLAKEAFEENQMVNLNMYGQVSVSNGFLNTTLGQLIDEYGIERVMEKLKFSNLLRSQADRIKKYVKDYSIVLGCCRAFGSALN